MGTGKTPKSENGIKARDLWERFDSGEIGSIQELVDEAESINNEQIQKATHAFRRFQEEDRILKGRGDWDEAEKQFVYALKGVAQKSYSKEEGGSVEGKEPLSSQMKTLLDKAISEKRSIDSVIIFSNAEREYLKKAGYVLEGDKYVAHISK